jgi:cell division protein FtsB
LKYLLLILIFIILSLQVNLWWGKGSILTAQMLQQEVIWQQEKINKLKERNQLLEAEVYDLKHHLSALEERARTDLGMIRQGETFYQYSLKENN